MKRYQKALSIGLITLMLMAMLSTVAFAAAPVITVQPVNKTVVSGDSVTFTVEAEGEDLSYQWYIDYNYTEHDNPIANYYDNYEGGDTPSLTILHTDCSTMNDAQAYYCIVSNADGSVKSDVVDTVVTHKLSDKHYDEEYHIITCERCDYREEAELHELGEGGCTVCAYDPADPQPAEPLLLDHNATVYANCGDEIELYVDAFGLGVEYKWVVNDQPTDHEGSTMNLGTLTCEQGGDLDIVCWVESAGIMIPVSYWAELEPDADGYAPFDSAEHSLVCSCGTPGEREPHVETDGDGVCDICSYEFDDKAPKILAQPQDAFIQNGENTTFTVEAEGEGLSYRWYYGDQALIESNDFFGGIDTATMTVFSVYDPDAEPYDTDYDCNYNGDQFACLVSNEYGSFLTDYAVYNVEHLDTDYDFNDIGHWKECYCQYIYDEEPHFDNNGDEICDACLYELAFVFEDVKNTGAWYFNAVNYCGNQGYFIGEYGYFNPDQNITRGQVATVLARYLLNGPDLDDASDEEFEEFLGFLLEISGEELPVLNDLNDQYYARPALILAALGFVKGHDDGTFRGDDFITRQELAVILARFMHHTGDEGQFGAPIDAFADADAIASWAEDSVEFCRMTALFQGDENGKFNPEASATRAEMAQLLYRIDL